MSETRRPTDASTHAASDPWSQAMAYGRDAWQRGVLGMLEKKHFELACAVDHARQAVGQHRQHGTQGGEQEHRCHCQLDHVCKVWNAALRKHGNTLVSDRFDYPGN